MDGRVEPGHAGVDRPELNPSLARRDNGENLTSRSKLPCAARIIPRKRFGLPRVRFAPFFSALP
ncbi:hypothetical protein C7U89_26745 [Bradyrhizobium sp. WBOS4]|nr:hypothetical protein [Bradyrhizobium sp. WBOS8]MDD1586507.1 hypothetical protein [Bradyrhizobium sp. WBOS4]UUO45693.1 hypothetical protein DCM78_01280 [Bradyrhizobium sp. WBOS04]UUO59309.1 hypothetical protein DCM80_09015 [Bradyrhizobium sp. WBOS08]